MSRTTWSMSDEAAEKLESVASRKSHESANDFILRVAEIVSEVNNTSGVTKRNAQGEGEDSGGCDVPEDVLTEAHIDDIANKAARQTVNDSSRGFGSEIGWFGVDRSEPANRILAKNNQAHAL